MSIFISYRRSDTDSAVLFYSWLRERFGPEQVFWDREDIAPGAQWVDVLSDRCGYRRRWWDGAKGRWELVELQY